MEIKYYDDGQTNDICFANIIQIENLTHLDIIKILNDGKYPGEWEFLGYNGKDTTFHKIC